MQKTLYTILGLIILAGLATGALYLKNQNIKNPDIQNQIVGGDQDQHGCLASAGFAWCSATNKCSRSFEELCPDAVNSLVEKITNATGLTLQKINNEVFTWNVRDGNNVGGTQINGLGFEVKNITRANYQKIEDYLKSNYEFDLNNVADGVVGGLRGYNIGYMACVLNFQQTQMKTNSFGLDEPVGDSLNVKFLCGYFNPNDIPKIMAVQAVKSFLATKYKKDITEVNVTITKLEGDYASGSVLFGKGGLGEGGIFLAVKKSGDWLVVYDGNGSIDCAKMRKDYAFPDSILKPNFCD